MWERPKGACMCYIAIVYRPLHVLIITPVMGHIEV